MAALLLATSARADPVEVAGLLFSDEDGGFTIVGGYGDGTIENPITIVEEITEQGAVTLIVRGFSPEWGNRLVTAHPAGFAFRKIVTNRTDQAWSSYDHELQLVRGVPSDLYDGLSFGQASEVGRPFVSDVYFGTTQIDEPRDFINFHDGEVKPGETVTFTYVITATSNVTEFYLVQDPNRLVAWLPHGQRRPG